MAITVLDLSFYQGDDFAYLIKLSNPDGTNLNVTGYNFASQAKLSYFNSNIAANLVVAITNASTGNLTLSLDSANTSNMAAGIYFYDVTMKDTSNTSSHLMSGQLIVKSGVTNIIPPNGGNPAL